MGKTLRRLRRWLPWADRAVGAPGAFGDWKELVKRLVPGGAAGATTIPEARGWIMGNIPPGWWHAIIVWTVIVACLISCARYMGRERRKASETERADAAARRLNRETRNLIAPGETEVSPEDAWRIATHEHAGYMLVEEFIRQHPEAYQKHPPRLDRNLFVRWLVAYRKARK